MIRSLDGNTPSIGRDCFIDELSKISGQVEIHDRVSVWPFVSIRGDMNKIIIGENTNIQDNSTVHVDTNSPTIIGKNTTIGHNAVIHGCEIGDDTLVGMGAILLNDVKVGRCCLIGAGALITPGTNIPDGSLVLGAPAKVKKQLSDKDREAIVNNSKKYMRLARIHLNSK